MQVGQNGVFMSPMRVKLLFVCCRFCFSHLQPSEQALGPISCLLMLILNSNSLNSLQAVAVVA